MKKAVVIFAVVVVIIAILLLVAANKPEGYLKTGAQVVVWGLAGTGIIGLGVLLRKAYAKATEPSPGWWKSCLSTGAALVWVALLAVFLQMHHPPLEYPDDCERFKQDLGVVEPEDVDCKNLLSVWHAIDRHIVELPLLTSNDKPWKIKLFGAAFPANAEQFDYIRWKVMHQDYVRAWDSNKYNRIRLTDGDLKRYTILPVIIFTVVFFLTALQGKKHILAFIVPFIIIVVILCSSTYALPGLSWFYNPDGAQGIDDLAGFGVLISLFTGLGLPLILMAMGEFDNLIARLATALIGNMVGMGILSVLVSFKVNAVVIDTPTLTMGQGMIASELGLLIGIIGTSFVTWLISLVLNTGGDENPPE